VAQALFAKKVRDDSKRPAVAARLKADLAGDGVAVADLVIEAIIEDAEAKRGLYQTLEPKMKADALLTTNTSSIPLGGTARPHPAPGPVRRPALLQPRRADAAGGNHPPRRHGSETERRLAAFCKALGKFPVPVAGTPGFLVNRVLFPYMLEAATAYAEGIPGPVIDKAAVKFGMPMARSNCSTPSASTSPPASARNWPRSWACRSRPPCRPSNKASAARRTARASTNGTTAAPRSRRARQLPGPGRPRRPPDPAAAQRSRCVACTKASWPTPTCSMPASSSAPASPRSAAARSSTSAPPAPRPVERLKALQQRYGDRFAPRPGWDDAVLREPVI
jgi:3-hydroxyacyl-CoA dehydrogenase/enoyl-CoA hydratase/3-hydroxybutyryl-CoA epimerase